MTTKKLERAVETIDEHTLDTADTILITPRGMYIANPTAEEIEAAAGGSLVIPERRKGQVQRYDA